MIRPEVDGQDRERNAAPAQRLAPGAGRRDSIAISSRWCKTRVARRDRVGAEQPQSERQAVGEGRDLFRRLYGGRDAVEFLAALYACGLGWRAAPAQAGRQAG